MKTTLVLVRVFESVYKTFTINCDDNNNAN